MTLAHRLECWGERIGPRPGHPRGRFTAVSVGQNYACAISMHSAALRCWGNNGNDGLVHPPAGQFTALSASPTFACAIDTAGWIKCWGNPDNDELDPPQLDDFTAVSTGNDVGCAIDNTGTIQCWGNPYSDIVTVPEGRYTSVSVGDDGACAVTASDDVQCWGNADPGSTSPPALPFTEVAISGHAGCGIKATTRMLKCWGSSAPRRVPAGKFVSISAGYEYFCAVSVQDLVHCWGQRGFGELGSPPSRPAAAPHDGTLGRRYQFTFTSSRGNPTGRYKLARGSLPPGLYLSGTGTIAGVPHRSGRFSFTVTVANLEGARHAKFRITVRAAGTS